MKKLALSGIVFGITLAYVGSLVIPGIARAEKTCGHMKLIADLNIDQLAGEGETFETVRKAYRRLANGVAVPLQLVLADNIVWKVEGVPGEIPFAGTYEGTEGMLDYMRDVKQSICIEKLYVRFYVQQGSVIHVHLYEEGVVASTGKRFTMDIAHVWGLNEEGTIASFREYNDTFAMQAAFDGDADPVWSLVANDADYDIPTSSFTDTLQAGLNLYGAFGSGDLDYIIQNSDPDLVWILAGPEDITPIAGTFYGHAGLIDFFTRVFTTEAYVDFYLTSITVDGSRMDVEVHEEVYVYATGKTFISDLMHTIIFNDDGKLRSFRSYNDTYAVAMGHLPGE